MASPETSFAGSFRIRLPTPNIVDLTADSDDEVQNNSSSWSTSTNHIGSSSTVRTNTQPSQIDVSRRSPHGVHPSEPIEIPSDDEDIMYLGAGQRRLPFASNLILPGTRESFPGPASSSRGLGGPHMPARAASGKRSEASQSCQHNLQPTL